MKKVNFSFSFFITGMLHHLIALSTFVQQVPSKLKQIGKSVIHCVHNFRELCKVYRCWQPGTMQAPQWGEKAEKRGEIGKIAVSEASLVVGRTTTYLAGFTCRFFFFFFANTDFFLLFSQCGAWAQTKRLVVSSRLHIWCQYREWCLHNGT